MRVWLTVIALGITFYAFFDCARTDAEKVRGIKWLWLIAIFLFELIAAIAWFIWGRPRKIGRAHV